MAQRSLAHLLLLVGCLVALRSLFSPVEQEVFVAPQLRGNRLTSAVMMNAASDDTVSKCADVIAEQLGVDKEKVTREATLSELGADSLDIVESVMALEEAFDVELPDEETTKLKNVGDVMDLIQSKL
eukprot:CAMPEP_0197646606 /NCGR_PEP_ID=MMETSP1338-20131121/23748_1 /TAXON_ID=43686 ORGANISM="Pelagodinium beii, Strain RCC1491" /NCGR_SAMPLE_ID=MMETSP1338 /ASSEMBLY_ACC=CAM_ASM_000754 /LENGTH=126 /DNA_ID=CAMNT_0043220257 /DNA_START=60 /DNA_END=440 /DNA_ORIENTATION=+